MHHTCFCRVCGRLSVARPRAILHYARHGKAYRRRRNRHCFHDNTNFYCRSCAARKQRVSRDCQQSFYHRRSVFCKPDQRWISDLAARPTRVALDVCDRRLTSSNPNDRVYLLCARIATVARHGWQTQSGEKRSCALEGYLYGGS